jgi:hypothetical protein
MAGVGEGRENLLVGGVLRRLGPRRIVGRLRCRDVQEGLAGDAQVLGLRVEFAEAGGEVLDGCAELPGLLVEFGLPGLDVARTSVICGLSLTRPSRRAGWRR